MNTVPTIDATELLALQTAGPAPSAVAARRSLRYNFAWSLAGYTAHGSCQWGLIVVLAQLGSTALVGEFALALAVTTPIVLLANCALRTIQASDSLDEFQFADYLAFRLAMLGLAAAVIVAITLAAGFAPTTRGALLAVGAAKLFESLGDLVHGAWQRHERMDLIGLSLIVKGLASLVVFAIAMLLTGSVVVASWGLAAVWAVVFALFDLPVCLVGANIGPISPRWDRRQLAALARLAFPMGVTVMLGALIANVPRYFLEYFRGREELGVFAALAWFTLISNTVASALAHAALPRLSQYYAAGDAPQFDSLMRWLFASAIVAGAAGVAVAAVAGPAILGLVYGPQYAEHSQIFTVLMFSMAFGLVVCFADHALYAARRFRVQAPINAVVTVLLFSGCWLAIPQAGLLGAAWATCAAMGLQALVRLIVLNRIARRLQPS